MDAEGLEKEKKAKSALFRRDGAEVGKTMLREWADELYGGFIVEDYRNGLHVAQWYWFLAIVSLCVLCFLMSSLGQG